MPGPLSEAPMLAVALPKEEAVEPGFEPFRIAELRKLAPGEEERLLDRVTGAVDVPDDPVRDGEAPVRVEVDELPEGGRIPGSGPFHWSLVHPPSLSSFTWSKTE